MREIIITPGGLIGLALFCVLVGAFLTTLLYSIFQRKK